MSRSDQYIGLNQKAWDFISELTKQFDYERDNFNIIDGNNTFCEPEGFTGYKIRVFYNDNVNEYGDFVETIQEEIWSSGPMYFSCLQYYLKKKYGQYIDMGSYCQWIKVPMFAIWDNVIYKEFDYEKGEIYI